jgi:hypothetical protein
MVEIVLFIAANASTLVHLCRERAVDLPFKRHTEVEETPGAEADGTCQGRRRRTLAQRGQKRQVGPLALRWRLHPGLVPEHVITAP